MNFIGPFLFKDTVEIRDMATSTLDQLADCRISFVLVRHFTLYLLPNHHFSI